MTRQRIENAVDVINYAIKHNISVKEASVKCGYADTYVKNVKAILKEKYDNDTIDDELFSFFMNKYDEYENLRNIGGMNQDTNIDTTKEKRIYGENTSLDVKGNVADVNWKGDKEHFDQLFDNKDQNNDNNNEIVFGYPKGHIKTLDELLDRCNVDTDIWDVDHYLVNKWDVTSWKNGGPETWENFQVKAKLKLKEAQHKAKLAGEVFQKMTENYMPPLLDGNFEKKKYKDEEGGENNLFEVALFDIHFGKLSWNGETGENFDTKIAKKRFLYALKKLIQRAQGYEYNRILFPIGNDFFNSDTRENTTSHGTPQDEDLRWQKTFEAGCELIVDGINILKQLGVPIDVVVIPGNHDFERSFFLGSYINAWFRSDSQINVNNAAKPRKYYRWGKVLLGFTHGRHEKENSLPMLMAKDKDGKKHWSETDFHEWHIGHFHRKKTKQFTVLDKTGLTDEEDGVIIRYLSSLTGTEEWHFLKGFVGQIKAGEGFIWNDKTGMIGHVNSNYIFEGSVEENNNIDDLLHM